MNAIKYYDEAIKKVDKSEITIGEYKRMINVLQDVEPVVRCRDCKFYYRMTAETGICQLVCRHLGNDGFCSEGEKDGGNNGQTE